MTDTSKWEVKRLTLTKNITLNWLNYIKYLHKLLITKNPYKSNLKLNTLNKQPIPVLRLRSEKNILTLFNSLNRLTVVRPYQHYYIHKNFKLFNYFLSSGKVLIANQISYFNKWKTSYMFLTNVFYFDLIDLFFGSRFFKNELYALSYLNLSSKNSLNFFNALNPVSTQATYSPNTSIVYNRLRLQGNSVAFMLNLIYFKQALHHLKRSNFFIAALVSSYDNPWSVHFPIPVHSSNHLTQFFFIKLLLYIKQIAIQSKYNLYKRVI